MIMDHYKAFLRAWLDFAENPDNNPMGFNAVYGLCTSLWDYGEFTGISGAVIAELDSTLSGRLMGMYEEDTSPFNRDPDVPSYTFELDKTKNPYRLAFVRKELGL